MNNLIHELICLPISNRTLVVGEILVWIKCYMKLVVGEILVWIKCYMKMFRNLNLWYDNSNYVSIVTIPHTDLVVF